MSSQTADSSAPILFNTLADLSQRLDGLSISQPPIAEPVATPERPRLETPPRVQPPRQALDNWAKKWRDGPSALSAASADKRPLRRERWPMVVGIGAVAWLVLTGGVIIACSVSDSSRRGYAVVPPAELPGEQTPAWVGAPINPAVEIQEAVDDLTVAPLRSARPDGIPALRPSDRPAAGNGCYGTKVEFVEDAAEAARLAKEKRRLMMVLNISGDFEESRFT